MKIPKRVRVNVVKHRKTWQRAALVSAVDRYRNQAIEEVIDVENLE